MTNIGVVGLGKMGLLHAGILNAMPNCSVVSIAEKESVLVKFAKKLLPNVQFYSNVSEMMNGEAGVDAIYVTTPISSHLAIVDEIVSNAKKIGVFVEKPLAKNHDDALRMVEGSAGIGLPTMVGFQKRFSPIFQKCKKMLDDRVLGELISFSSYSYVSGVFSEGKGWRFKSGQGGALLDLGPHLFDILVWYFGPPTKIEGQTRSLYSTEVDDMANGRLAFATGFSGSFDISWSIHGYRLPEIGIQIIGTKGKLKVTDDYLKLETNSSNLGGSMGNYDFRKPDFNTNVDFLIADPEYCIEDKYFIDCLSHGTLPQPDFSAGATINEIISKVSNQEFSILGIA